MNSNRNGWDSTKWTKNLYFQCGPSTKNNKNLKRDVKKQKDIFKIQKHI